MIKLISVEEFHNQKLRRSGVYVSSGTPTLVSGTGVWDAENAVRAAQSGKTVVRELSESLSQQVTHLSWDDPEYRSVMEGYGVVELAQVLAGPRFQSVLFDSGGEHEAQVMGRVHALRTLTNFVSDNGKARVELPGGTAIGVTRLSMGLVQDLIVALSKGSIFLTASDQEIWMMQIE